MKLEEIENAIEVMVEQFAYAFQEDLATPRVMQGFLTTLALLESKYKHALEGYEV